MTDKTIKCTISTKRDMWGEICSEKVSFEGQQSGYFQVYNLNECPEDAIIGRELFDAADYLSAVRFGMKLAQEGYNQIAIENIHDED